jgi:recombination protein RecA
MAAAAKLKLADLSKKSPADIARALSGRIQVLADIGKDLSIDVIPTGLKALDEALACGGLPLGRIIELFGAYSHGKTTLALHCVGQVLKNGGKAAFIDAEHAVDPSVLSWFGIEPKQLLFHQPDSGEEALNLVQDLMKSKAVKIVVVDSVAALIPQEELERGFDEKTIGLQARMMSLALRKLSASVAEAKAVLLFLNQTRVKIGVFMGNPTDTPGGQALKFWAGQRWEIKRVGAIKKGDKTIGIETRVRIVKNKCGNPFRVADLELIFGKGWRSSD